MPDSHRMDSNHSHSNQIPGPTASINIKTLLTAIPVATATLYLLGVSYHQGYLRGFGLDDSLFVIPIDKSLLFGFFALVSMGIEPLMYAIFTLLISATTLFLVVAFFSTSWITLAKTKIEPWIIKMRSVEDRPPAFLVRLIELVGTAFVYVIGVFIVTFLLIVCAVMAGKSGEEQAQTVIAKFARQEGNYVSFKTRLKPELQIGKQIGCGVSHCAIWDGEHASIFQHDEIIHLTAFTYSPK